jgi:hypothetical protein
MGGGDLRFEKGLNRGGAEVAEGEENLRFEI